jgi:hypothetical protein
MIGWRGKRAFVSNAIDVVGLKQVSDVAWEVYFGPIFLGMLSDTRPDLGLVRTPK